MPTDFSRYFFTQGVLGVTLVALAIVFIYYYRTSQKKLDEQAKTIFDLQTARLEDSKQLTKDVTAVLEGNSQANRVLAEKISLGKGQGNL